MVLGKNGLKTIFSPKFNKMRSKAQCNQSSDVSDGSGTTSDVKVFIRVRPFNEKEFNSSTKNTVKIIDKKMLVFDPKETEEQFFFHGQKQKTRDINKKVNKDLEFVFDSVFPPESTNNEVFECSTKNIITSLLDGYNCSVFVYGATGSGKTHTMLGSKDQPGITYLTMVNLYDQLDQLSDAKDFHLGVSYIEVYNENVHDLLQPSSVPLHLREDANGAITVAGLNVTTIQNSNQLFELLEFGNKNRTQHPTDANAESSRSHAVFQVYVRMSGKRGEETKLVKLSMIDLAGSERGLATGYKGSRFKEGSNINKSLLALGNCINKLADGHKHIPYRDSKLTRLLKDSLGGNCQTVMIANVSPALQSYEETYNTLKYATRAKKIKSRLSKNIVSVEMHVGHYIKIVEELKKENAKLKNHIRTLELAATKPTVMTVPPGPDPRHMEKMCTLFKDRKDLFSKLLSLESQEKTFEWRIRHKQLIASQLENISSDEDDQGINRVQQTLKQLEARAAGVRGNITETLSLYKKHNQQYLSFITQLEQSKTKNLLEKDVNIKNYQVLVSRYKMQQLHHEKLILMQDKRHESQYSIITNLSGLNSRFYLLLKVNKQLTSALENEYQSMVRMLEGVKGVSWNDIDDGIEDDEGTTFSSASVRPFMTLTILSQRMPDLPEEPKSDKTPEEGDAGSELNNTYVAESGVCNPLLAPEVTTNSTLVRGHSFKTSAPISSTSLKSSRNVSLQKSPLSKFSVKKDNNNGNTRSVLAPLHINKIIKPTPLSQSVKPQNPRIPLNTLKMNKVNSRTVRRNHPYLTPISSLGHRTRNISQPINKKTVYN